MHFSKNSVTLPNPPLSRTWEVVKWNKKFIFIFFRQLLKETASVAASAVNFYPLRLVILCNRNKRLSGLQNRHKLFLLYFLLWSWRGSFLNGERERGESDSIEGEKGEGKSPLRTRRERGCLCFVYFPLPFMTTDEKDGRKKGEIYFFSFSYILL